MARTQEPSTYPLNTASSGSWAEYGAYLLLLLCLKSYIFLESKMACRHHITDYCCVIQCNTLQPYHLPCMCMHCVPRMAVAACQRAHTWH